MRLTKLFEENLTVDKTQPSADKHSKESQPQKKTEEFKKELDKNINTNFINEVKELAKKYNVNFFLVTDDDYAINCNNEYLDFLKQKHLEWKYKIPTELNTKDFIEQAKQKIAHTQIPQHLEKQSPNLKQAFKAYGFEIKK